MTSQIQDFGRTAQKLTRNPLGIIALFIVLVYGIAGLVFGLSYTNLEPVERQPLVWFLVVFPVLVLAVFYRLVTKYHFKLYAPHDFPDAEGFFRAQTPSEQKKRFEEEIQEFELESLKDENNKAVAMKMAGAGRSKELSGRHTWVLAEELAFRELESMWSTNINRHVIVDGDSVVDGIFFDDLGNFRVFEIKFTNLSKLKLTIQRAAEQLGRIAEKNERTYFTLAIVLDGIAPELLEQELAKAQEQLKSMPFPIDLCIYDFGELKEKYGITEVHT